MTWDVVVRIGNDMYEPWARVGVPRLITVFEQSTDSNFVHNNSLDLIRTKTGLEPPPISVDLVHLAMAVYSADLRVNRKHGKDRWSRDFVLHIPVAEPVRWVATAPLLSRTLRYLTGDNWELRFRERIPLTTPPPGQPRLNPARAVSLFSGGLDSLVGAIDLLHANTTVALVGHHGAGITNDIQQTVLQILRPRYAASITDFMFYVQPPRSNTQDGESSMRSRSILFLSLGIAVAATLGDGTPLYVAENGLISLNVPLTPSRSGSSSTRTTHPHFLGLLRELLIALGIHVPIETPYRFKTKGEMLRECLDQATLAQASVQSMSCSHPESGRFRGRSPSQHCGYCVPCIIRRASLHAAGLPQGQYSIDVLTHPPGAGTDTGRDLRAFHMALERLCDAPATRFLFDVMNTGPLPPRDASSYADVYRRGMAEVRGLLG
jgi:hypothetical protein